MRDLSKQDIVNGLMGGCLGIVGAILLTPRETTISSPNAAAPRDTLDLVTCIVLLAVLTFVGGIAARRALNKSAVNELQERARLRRSPNQNGSRFLRYQIILILILFIYLRDESWTYTAIGVKDENSAVVAFLCGVIVYLLFIAVFYFFYYVGGNYSAQADNNLRTMALIWPRSSRQRIAMIIGMCVLNPITEEIIYRGILVHQFSLALGSWGLPIVVGLLVSLVNHAYQGYRAILTHALFYAFAVALLVSPAGLIGCIGMHFAGDFLPVYWLRGNMIAYRARHQRAMPLNETELIPGVES